MNRQGDQSYTGPAPQIYSKIQFKVTILHIQTKIRLVKMISDGGKIRSIAKILKIKESTAKMIWKKFKDTGKIGKKVINLNEENAQKVKVEQIEINEAPRNYSFKEEGEKPSSYYLQFYPFPLSMYGFPYPSQSYEWKQNP